MKKLIATAFIAGLVVSTGAMAAGSKIEGGSDVTVKSINKHAVTKAQTNLIGAGDANTGGASLNNSKIKNSNVTIKSNNRRARTTAGANGVANTGGLTAHNSEVKNSTVLIDSKNQHSRTTAEGADFLGGATATTGGVTLR